MVSTRWVTTGRRLINMVKILNKEMLKDHLADDAFQLDGLGSAIIGITYAGYLVYDYEKIVRHFVSQGMDREEAIEYTDYNVVSLGGDFANWVIISKLNDIL